MPTNNEAGIHRMQLSNGLSRAWLAGAACAALALSEAVASPGPTLTAPGSQVPAPKDRPYPGQLSLTVDVSDVANRVVQVHESITGVRPDTILLYPKWLPGTHAPEGPIDRFAGLKITADGAPVAWTRDPADVYALRIHAPARAASIDVDFTYLSPTSLKVGALEIGRDVLLLEWNAVVLYPAGYFARQIPVHASLRLPNDWQFGTALEVASADGAESVFKAVDLETLIDSPVYAGRHAARLDLDPGSKVPVHLDVFADRAEQVVITPEQLEAHRSLVRQAYRLFGSHHYAHYDFLYSLSDEIQQNGLEHHQSSEDGADPDSFVEWDKNSYGRDLLAHEFTHSWNGKFRRPADLWTPNYNVPMQDSLLWVYEGQTQYWGQVLAARSGLWSKQQALDQLALTAAYFQNEAGRRWRPLEDTTNDEILNPRRPLSWRDWQRFEDYYDEGQLVWLEADTLIRERSGGRRSLDDFARSFFGIDDGDFGTVTYTFEDIVKALNAVEPFDWAHFLRERLDGVNRPAPLDGLTRGGYRLIYTDTPSDYQKSHEEQAKVVDLLYSVGLQLDDKDGTVQQVMWDSPAFKANVTEGSQIVAINGVAYCGYCGTGLKDAVKAAQKSSAPTELIVKNGDFYRVVMLDYHGGLRYPHLERDGSATARLDDILAPRP